MGNRVVSMLTDRQAKLAKKTVAVGGVKGLTLRVRETGTGLSKYFVMRMTVDGKPVEKAYRTSRPKACLLCTNV